MGLVIPLAKALLFLALALVAWRWASAPGVYWLGPRHFGGLLIGLIALVFSGVAVANLAGSLQSVAATVPANLTFLTPVQQANNVLAVEVANVPETSSASRRILPSLAARHGDRMGLRVERREKPGRAFFVVTGWTLLAWAALRLPNGAPMFLLAVAAFMVLHVLFPAVKPLLRVPARPNTSVSPATAGASPAATLLLIGSLVVSAIGAQASSWPADAQKRELKPGIPESVVQQIQVADDFATATAKIHWRAEKDQALPLLFEPAVLTHITFPKSLKLEAAPAGSHDAQRLVAPAAGSSTSKFSIKFKSPNAMATAAWRCPCRAASFIARH